MLKTFAENNFVVIASLFIESCCLLVKIAMVRFLYKEQQRRNYYSPSWWSAFVILLTAAFTNLSLIVCALGCPPFEIFSLDIVKFFLRLDNASFALQFYAIFVLSQNLTMYDEEPLPNMFKSFTIVSVIYFIAFSIYHFFTLDAAIFYRYYTRWTSVVLIEGFVSLLIFYKNYKIEMLSLLRQQIKIFGLYFMLPYLIFKIWEHPLFCQLHFFTTTTLEVNFLVTSIASLWLTAIIYIAARKLVRAYFLNIGAPLG